MQKFSLTQHKHKVSYIFKFVPAEYWVCTYVQYTVNVYFVTLEYVLLIKYQSISIWKFNLPIKQHNLIGPQYWEFSQEVLLMWPVGRGGGFERMLLDSIIMCIAYCIWPPYLEVSQEVLLMLATMGRGGWVIAGYWTASYVYANWSCAAEAIFCCPTMNSHCLKS